MHVVSRGCAWSLALSLLSHSPAFAQAPSVAATSTVARPAANFEAALTIRADRPGSKIDRRIYGNFAEHLGRGIYEGITLTLPSKSVTVIAVE